MKDEKTLDILNQILEKGYYEEEYEILPNFRVTFKTRTHEEEFKIREYYNKLDLEPKTVFDFGFFNIHYALPYAIKAINGQPFEGSYEDKLEYLNRLPQVLHNAIVMKFQDFEKKISSVFEVENIKK